MNSNDIDHIGVILEEIRDQDRGVLEAVGDMQNKVSHLPQIDSDIRTLKVDMSIVKAAVTV